MGFLPSCGRVHTTVWMHVIDANKKLDEKAGLELHKKGTNYFEPTSHETTV